MPSSPAESFIRAEIFIIIIMMMVILRGLEFWFRPGPQKSHDRP